MLSWIWQSTTDDEKLDELNKVLDSHVSIGTIRHELTPARVDKLHFPPQSLGIVFDKYLIAGSKEYISIHELQSGEKIVEVSSPFDWVNGISIVNGATPLIVTAHNDGIVRIWDFFDFDTPVKNLRAHIGGILAIDVLQGPFPRIVSCGYDGIGRVWDPNSGLLVGTLKGHRHSILAVVVCQNPLPVVITGDGGGVVIAWDLQTYLPFGKRQSASSAVKSLAIASGSQPLLVVGRQNGTIQIYKLISGQHLLTIQAHTEQVKSLLVWGLAENSPLLISGSCDCSIRIWNLLTGELLKVLHGHEDEVSVLAGTQGRKLIVASGGMDKRVNIWDLDDFTSEVIRRRYTSSTIPSLSFSSTSAIKK